MIIYFFPLVPVIIGVFLIASALVDSVAQHIDTIHTIFFVLILLFFVCVFIHIVRNGIEGPRRIIAAVLSVVSCVISLIGLEQLMSLLSAAENPLFILFEFALPAVIGGAILLCIIFGSMILCLNIAGL
ncbi:MAG: hypothetical protein IJB36_06870 [Clostridia bacterium]|nr:hypothetical protein [Clostridia bacterium]